MSNEFKNACMANDLKEVKRLHLAGADIHAEDECALRWSSSIGHIEVVKYLVENGAVIITKSGDALCWACRHGHIEVVKYLVENGAVIDQFAFLWAISGDYHEVTEYLKGVIRLRKLEKLLI